MVDFLARIGLAFLARSLISLFFSSLYAFKTYILPKYITNDEWIRSLGSWAAVTGCTHGIGLAYAKELAKRNMNLILIARNEQSLKKVSQVLGWSLSLFSVVIAATQLFLVLF
jgi:17beta-estradiol 17-dehydrogenase / very-long-chain 3-oxoacyl-CoA reductase